MKYIVSSNINYYKNTYTPLITSLIDCGIDPKDILMVVGGCFEDSVLENLLDINIVPALYNSFDLTGLIYAAENSEKFLDTNYFLLHDTCLVGTAFKKLSEQIEEGTPIRTLTQGLSMNIGMYSLQALNENRENLSKLKYYPQTEAELQQVKEIFVLNEDIIFRLYQNYYQKNSYIKTHPEAVTVLELKERFKKPAYQEYFNTLENSTVKRLIGYSPSLDFYKFQANWKWDSTWKIGV